MFLKSPGQWVETNLEANEPQVFTFKAEKDGVYCIYLASMDATDASKATVDVDVDGKKGVAGGYNGRAAFQLEAGNHSVVLTARSDTHRQVIYYANAMGVSKARIVK